MEIKTVIFVGPSAVGKTYAAAKLQDKFPQLFENAQLYTTRPPRTGEQARDRIFIEDEAFDKMISRGDFIVHDEFGGSRYGFTRDSLFPKQKHLLVNAWPWLIPQFAKLSHVLFVGMQAPDNYKSFLAGRMGSRGDTQSTIEKRLKLIERDQADLKSHKKLVEKQGLYAVIQNDLVLEAQIVPWIEQKLRLS